MQFILGYLAGISTAILIVVTLIYFRKTIEPIIQSAQRIIERAGPQSKGFIFEPLSDEEEARQEVIESNKKEGKDTNIQELL